MKRLNRIVLLVALLAGTLGINNGGCTVYYDVEVIVPPGGSVEQAQVLIFNMKSGEKAIVSWQEFQEIESIDDLHRP